ncbi:hypothetical protein FRC08_012261 [Ceratobasidium sp. 394]|nr:hypothetical protein FRC08_012261 [Ceratobasidium sp. 394]
MVGAPNLVDWSGHTAFLPYGERWKHQRQLMHSSFSKNSVRKYWSVQTELSRKMAMRMTERPDVDFVAEFTRMSGAQILSCVYGHEVTASDDPVLKLVEGAAAHLGEALLPTNFLVNIFPWLRYVPEWFPGAGWEQVASEWRQELRDTIEIHYRFTVKQMADGTAPPSALSKMLADVQTHPGGPTQELMDRIMWTAGTLYTAATDSLISTLQVFMLAMMLHPEVQVKIQKEIDQITGGKRMPESGDAERMPYMRCVILEVLRW